ncbi:class F sortase [Actinomadura sp. 7K507]|uniref:class F sortase n=1 Tax=Actinomadura sp. 7K507 TaxID=2530365 RepID=UPI00104ADF72|nr:class F sortase [Actinomadura sp. 7K507]TDC78261.1 class F sortase [Actinomadura sp. 7K507]
MPELSATAAGRRAMGVAAGALLTGLLLSGCGSEDGGTAEGSPSASASAGTTAAAASAPLTHSQPTKIAIEKIGVSAPISDIGLLPNGRVEEPPLSKPNLVGWYKEGVTPGEIGPSVLLGHVDAHGKNAVFYRLKELNTGDQIKVARKDGTTATFAVEKKQRVDKNAFPHKQVFAASLDHASLRLVTCGGAFDPESGHYKDNVIIYAKLVTA